MNWLKNDNLRTISYLALYFVLLVVIGIVSAVQQIKTKRQTDRRNLSPRHEEGGNKSRESSVGSTNNTNNSSNNNITNNNNISSRGSSNEPEPMSYKFKNRKQDKLPQNKMNVPSNISISSNATDGMIISVATTTASPTTQATVSPVEVVTAITPNETEAVNFNNNTNNTSFSAMTARVVTGSQTHQTTTTTTNNSAKTRTISQEIVGAAVRTPTSVGSDGGAGGIIVAVAETVGTTRKIPSKRELLAADSNDSNAVDTPGLSDNDDESGVIDINLDISPKGGLNVTFASETIEHANAGVDEYNIAKTVENTPDPAQIDYYLSSEVFSKTSKSNIDMKRSYTHADLQVQSPKGGSNALAVESDVDNESINHDLTVETSTNDDYSIAKLKQASNSSIGRPDSTGNTEVELEAGTSEEEDDTCESLGICEFFKILCTREFVITWISSLVKNYIISATALVYALDIVTDVNVMIFWLNKAYFVRKEDRDERVGLFAIASLVILMFYRCITSYSVYNALPRTLGLRKRLFYGFLQFLDVFIFVEVAESYRKGERTDRLLWINAMEAAIEAAPQIMLCLFCFLYVGFVAFYCL